MKKETRNEKKQNGRKRKMKANEAEKREKWEEVGGWGRKRREWMRNEKWSCLLLLKGPPLPSAGLGFSLI